MGGKEGRKMERGADLCENGREEGKEVRAGEREREYVHGMCNA